MSNANQNGLIVAPVPNSADYTVSAEVWSALAAEINAVSKRIDDGEELTPEDVVNVRGLKKQVESYLTLFNKAMRDAQADYKGLVERQLEQLGYGKIESYIQEQRKKQTDEQNERLAEKQQKLRELVSEKLEGTKVLKSTSLAGELLPAFVHRFPNVNSSAKTKEITNWEPYGAVIRMSMVMLDTFFQDKIFDGAATLPVTSATMQQLLKYVRDGNLDHLAVMRDVFAKDAEYLLIQKLKGEITDREKALAAVSEALQSEGSTPEQKIQHIGRIIRIAETL